MKRYVFLLLFSLIIVLTACNTDSNTEIFNVRYDLDGGTMTSDGTYMSEVQYGHSILEPEVSKENFGLEGWYTDSTFNVPYDFSQPVYGDLRIYAKWTEIETYNLNINVFNQIVTQETYLPGEIVSLPLDYIVEGYMFDGIYTDETFTQELPSEMTMPENDVDLYIKLVPIVNEINVLFVPSRPTDEILSVTAPLSDLLSDELDKLGYSNYTINISVASTYEAAGEALLAGTADIAFLPGGTYVAYKDVEDSPLQIILAATRPGISKDSFNAMDWNDGIPTIYSPTNLVPYYKSLIIAGPSAAGMALATKVNAGTELVWDDVKDLNWCTRSLTSSSGYIYPKIWLKDNFDKSFDDILGAVVSTSGYGDSMASLAAGTCDVATFYADARMHYVEDWTSEFGRTQSIWDETNVIGVTDNIMNDTITASIVNLDQDLIDAIAQAFINISQTQDGAEVISIYSHVGYVFVTDEDYDSVREAWQIQFE
jgi:phosphonate transport system substrate-binding protein